MNVGDLLTIIYTWCNSHADLLAAGSVGLPVTATALARIGKGGKTDADGRFIASTMVAIAIVLVALEIVSLVVATSLLHLSILDANVFLLLAPMLCLFVTVLGIRLVFPLSELGSVKTAVDMGVFLFACGIALWLLSKFRGWGIVFLGSIGQLIVILFFAVLLMQRLYRRAFRRK